MREKVRQFGEAWRHVRQIDSRLVPYVVAGGLIGLFLGLGLGFVLPLPGVFSLVSMALFGILFALLGILVVFGRRAQKAQFQALDGQPGAAAAVLQNMRGQWFVAPAVAVNTKQDMVHRVVGRCGVVLVGEGSGQRVKGLMAKERKRLSRVVGDVPMHSIVVGDRDDQVPLPKLQMSLTKLKRPLSKTEVPRLERKLKPLDKAPPIPKGIDPFAAANRRRPKPR